MENWMRSRTFDVSRGGTGNSVSESFSNIV